MRVSMAAIIQQAERKFNLDEADGVNRRHTAWWPAAPPNGRSGHGSRTGSVARNCSTGDARESRDLDPGSVGRSVV
jgi:hypothetical protein